MLNAQNHNIVGALGFGDLDNQWMKYNNLKLHASSGVFFLKKKKKIEHQMSSNRFGEIPDYVDKTYNLLLPFFERLLFLARVPPKFVLNAIDPIFGTASA